MSQGFACKNKAHRPSWRVYQRRGNRSAFSGYHWTPSDYSAVLCLDCYGGERGEDSTAIWRTKADYVDGLPDIKPGEEEAAIERSNKRYAITK